MKEKGSLKLSSFIPQEIGRYRVTSPFHPMSSNPLLRRTNLAKAIKGHYGYIKCVGPHHPMGWACRVMLILSRFRHTCPAVTTPAGMVVALRKHLYCGMTVTNEHVESALAKVQADIRDDTAGAYSDEHDAAFADAWTERCVLLVGFLDRPSVCDITCCAAHLTPL